VRSLAHYMAGGGGCGLAACATRRPDEVIDIVVRSGLRGHGGAGFPVGRKWSTIADGARAAAGPASVVVNGAEGEPGTFKDRMIIRRNPYVVVEGACVAAHAVQADRVVIALKRSFATEVQRIRAAVGEMRAARLLPDHVCIEVFEGPDEYLYGEETALLETIDGRGPFPRVVPPYRVGLCAPSTAGRWPDPPTLVNNVETVANLPRLVDRGPDWFRSVGTDASPGTVVCTVSGDVRWAGVGEFRFGVPLRTVIRALAGGPRPGAPIKVVMSGVANQVIHGDRLDTAVSYESLVAAGSGLGAAGFIVFDDRTDAVALAAGVARFLSVESCGQCTPCKSDGTELAALLALLCRNRASVADLSTIERRIATVSFGARCALGGQQETVLHSLLADFRAEFDAHAVGRLPACEPIAIGELADLRDGKAIVDAHQLAKQPDWSFAARSSGATPVDLRAR
jgi:NADH-quinone oxidoreductase subunit F